MSPISLIHHVFNTFCPNDSAIVTGEGEVLFLKAKNPLSVGTLGVASQTVMKYFPLKVGEVAMLNDPYSGGSTLNEFTFITKLVEAGPQSLWWAWRKHLEDKINLCQSVEEEGLRIPPTPIYQNHQINQVILSAMSGHPLCPPDFSAWVEKACAEMQVKIAGFNHLLQKQKINLGKNVQKDYLNESRKVAHEKISESASGETRVEVYLDSKEMIRLHTDIHEGQISMDFSGTSVSKTNLLTESATYGICFEAIARFYGFKKIINTGSFSVLQVSKPSLCLLNAKYPAPLNAGAKSVQAALHTAVALTLSQIHSKKSKSLCAFSPIELELKNARGESLQLRLPGGAGAQGENVTSACAFAKEETLSEEFSIEKIERNWPVKISRVDYRHSLHGKGQINGGRGLSLKMEFTASAQSPTASPTQLAWRTDLTQFHPKLPKNCTSGDSSVITWHSASGEEKNLPSKGALDIKAGDSIVFCSGAGGGWGTSKADAKADS